MSHQKPSDVLSRFLFWDVNPDETDFSATKIWIVKRVLTYGLLSDLQYIFQLYGKEEIAEIAVNIKELDIRTASFVSLITDTPIEQFKCFTTIQSNPPHWNF